MYVQGITTDDEGREEYVDIGTVSNHWTHNGHPATHYYDVSGYEVGILWSTVISTPNDVKEMIMMVDCHEAKIWEVEGEHSGKLGWGLLQLDNGKVIDFTPDVWKNKEKIVEQESGKAVMDVQFNTGSVDVKLTELGIDLLPEASEDARIFVLLMGTATLRFTGASPG
eukprot:CAMPEP_0181319094 /NCGR_PEP_ID=MMETSP1101-20121128/17376_1 /TAXON_ID=46948 /ORGANISM="Rhodomonas abbreviata, Strain Caron Lab Isolate" /LENGTH=167 /DNA_ID=CAMNT_0023426647 /DNA_START=135 /DNA_END=634 /DNA_ORIENTATION=+